MVWFGTFWLLSPCDVVPDIVRPMREISDLGPNATLQTAQVILDLVLEAGRARIPGRFLPHILCGRWGLFPLRKVDKNRLNLGSLLKGGRRVACDSGV